MSMRDYAVDDYGLVLTMDELHVLATKAIGDFDESEWNSREILDEMYELGIVECIGNFTGEWCPLLDDETFDWAAADYSDDCIYYIPASNYPTLFKKAYENVDELIAEFKEKAGKYLPDDFNYREHIMHISGTYYG